MDEQTNGLRATMASTSFGEPVVYPWSLVWGLVSRRVPSCGVEPLAMLDILGIQAHVGVSGCVELDVLPLLSDLWRCWPGQPAVAAGRTFFCSSGAFPIWRLLASRPLARWLLLGSVWRRKVLGSRSSPCLMCSLPAVSPCAQVPDNYPPAGFCC